MNEYDIHVVWHGEVWYAMEWYGVARYCNVWQGIVWYELCPTVCKFLPLLISVSILSF